MSVSPLTNSLGDRSPNQELLPLSAKVNSRDCLEIGGCDVTTLVEQFGSPLYILDEVTLRTACRQYRDAMSRYYKGESLVLYASKAWSTLAVCAIAASEGLGIDVVSGVNSTPRYKLASVLTKFTSTAITNLLPNLNWQLRQDARLSWITGWSYKP
jgi:hypothetical protein